MIRLAANLSTLFGQAPLLQRFALAASAGFRAAELQFPYRDPAEDIASAANAAGIEISLINAPAGNMAAGERGLALEGGARFEASVRQAIHTATRLGCSRVHVLVGRHETRLQGAPLERAAKNLRRAAHAMAEQDITLILEALNPHDQPGYALLSLPAADALRQAVGLANVKLMLDAYHAGRRGEDPLAAIQAYLPVVGNVQIARSPDRGEPDGPETLEFLAALDAHGYTGFVGCEYNPVADTMAGLGWARPFGISAPP